MMILQQGVTAEKEAANLVICMQCSGLSRSRMPDNDENGVAVLDSIGDATFFNYVLDEMP